MRNEGAFKKNGCTTPSQKVKSLKIKPNFEKFQSSKVQMFKKKFMHSLDSYRSSCSSASGNMYLITLQQSAWLHHQKPMTVRTSHLSAQVASISPIMLWNIVSILSWIVWGRKFATCSLDAEFATLNAEFASNLENKCRQQLYMQVELVAIPYFYFEIFIFSQWVVK